MPRNMPEVNVYALYPKHRLSVPKVKVFLDFIQALEKNRLAYVPKALLAHCVWADESEIALMAERSIGVAHNPISNMKLASGAAPVVAMLKAGVAVGLGTDGEKENNNLDMFEEMKASSLLAKFSNLDAAALDA